MHSPLHPLTVEGYQDWKIPPCLSNWKNPKGYTIPLDKRLAADDGEVLSNDKFVRFSEAFNVANCMLWEEAEMRSKVQKEMVLRETKRKEPESGRALAQEDPSEMSIGGAPPLSPVHMPTSDRIISDGGEDMRVDYGEEE
ncbi:hypothetical protein MKX03_020882 [Papaver bracteatum]|nr:hypothetical protein MKX03_020882 [Papaver bracteatum]